MTPREEYIKVLNSGMFFEWYPHLSGNWEKDKAQWLVHYAELEAFRRENKKKQQ